jgi:hypothetical protein
MSSSKTLEQVTLCYRKLGGRLNVPPLQFGPWDICTSSFIIELDEERHFNRYRLNTLDDQFYKKSFPYFNVVNYRTYCLNNEPLCLRAAGWGGNWKNKSTERQFLSANVEGSLLGNGSSRWRQRAYYDYVKDVVASIVGVPLFRFSIYEQVDNLTLGDHLESRLINQDLVMNFVSKRVDAVRS